MRAVLEPTLYRSTGGCGRGRAVPALGGPLCNLGCFIFDLFSPIFASRPDSRYFIHLMNFGASHSILKPISCYAEIRQSFQVLCRPALKSPL